MINSNLSSPRKRLLVIKHGALGDIVQGFGAFASLRYGNPNAHIALLTTPPFSDLALMTPWFDEVLVDYRTGILNILQSFRMSKILQADWDLIVDMQCSERTGRYFKLFARTNVRWVGTVKGCSDPCPDFTGVSNYQRMRVAAQMAGGIEIELDMGWLLEKPTIPPKVRLPSAYAILVPGCSKAKPQKRWPSEKFAQLADVMLKKRLAVVLVGTLADRKVVDAVIDQVPGCLDLCGKTNLANLASICASANFVVGNDTGPVFLAAITGAPTIMLMGPDTDPSMSSPAGQRCDWIQCTRIANITVSDVLAKLSKLEVGFV